MRTNPEHLNRELFTGTSSELACHGRTASTKTWDETAAASKARVEEAKAKAKAKAKA